MGHYECKTCGRYYDSCTCPALKPARKKKERPVVIPEIDISELGDYDGNISNLISILQKLLKEHGDTKIRFDAGANNVSCIIQKPVEK